MQKTLSLLYVPFTSVSWTSCQLLFTKAGSQRTIEIGASITIAKTDEISGQVKEDHQSFFACFAGSKLKHHVSATVYN